MVADVHGKLQRVEQQLLEGLPAPAVQALVAGLLQLDRRLVQASQPLAAGTCDPEAP
jgi:MarR family transcriptional regulator for hemolysin